MNGLFTQSKNDTTTVNEFTATLNKLSHDLANEILVIISKDEEKFSAMVMDSLEDSNVLTDIMETSGLLKDYDALLVAEKYVVSETEAASILKSQQSNRSRLKKAINDDPKTEGLPMDKYRGYLSAAIAEHTIRIVGNIKRGASGQHTTFVLQHFSEQQVENYKNDQLALSKMVRNLQSRKSTGQKKKTLSTDDVLVLVGMIKQLTDVRSTTPIVNKTAQYNQIAALFTNIDSIDKLKLQEAKDLLHLIASI